MMPEIFAFVELAKTFDDPDYDRMILTFNWLRPVYFYVEGDRGAVSAPSKVTMKFNPGFPLGVAETLSHTAAKSAPMCLRHKLIKKALCDLLVVEHGKDAVGGEQPSESDGLIGMLAQPVSASHTKCIGSAIPCAY